MAPLLTLTQFPWVTIMKVYIRFPLAPGYDTSSVIVGLAIEIVHVHSSYLCLFGTRAVLVF